jgi:hypothetical protein
VTDQVTVTDVVTDTLVIISETVIVPITYPPTSYEPNPTQGPVQQPTQTSWVTAPPGWDPSQGLPPDQTPPVPTQSTVEDSPPPVPTQTTVSDSPPIPTQTTVWDSPPVPTQTTVWDSPPADPTQPTVGDVPPPVPTQPTVGDAPPPVPTQSTILDSPPPQSGTQSGDQVPPVETVTTLPPEWGSAPYNPFGPATQPPITQPPSTASPQDTPAPTSGPENPPGPTPVPTTTIVPLADFTPGPDAPTDVDLPPLFDPGLGPTGGPIVVVPADMQSPARCGPNQPNCADGYYCDPQPLCSIGQNCPGLCLPKLASIYSQPDNMRSAVWDKAMRDGIYRLAIVVTEIRTAIPITTNGKWLTLASNGTGEHMASASPFKNATASVAMPISLLTADGAASASALFANATASMAGVTSLLTAETARIASPLYSNATVLATSTPDVLLPPTKMTQALASSAIHVELNPSSVVVESLSVSVVVPSSTAIFQGKWLNGTSNSTSSNYTAHR